MNAAEIIDLRERTHGDFADVARVAQKLKAAMRSSPRWLALSDVRREALESIAVKIARIICGDPAEPDHWDDIGGYAELAKRSVS